jgi:hypothetical protein
LLQVDIDYQPLNLQSSPHQCRYLLFLFGSAGKTTNPILTYSNWLIPLIPSQSQFSTLVMARDLHLDSLLIRNGKHAAVAAYVLQLIKEHNVTLVCNALLSAVETESISPLIFSIFLSCAESVDCIILCLRQQTSDFVRQQGIKYFGRVLKDPTIWQEAWNGLGGINGIIQYMTTISVVEVKSFLTIIGSCNRGYVRSEGREQAIEELLMAQLPSIYPNSRYRSPEERPLQDYVAKLLPGCSARFISDLLVSGPDAGNPLYTSLFQKRMFTSHGPVLRQYALLSAFKKEDRYALINLISTYTSREPPKQAEETKFSASMSFSLELLERRISTPKIAPDLHLSEDVIYFSLLRRCIKKRVSMRRLHEIMELGLKLLEVKPEYKKGQFTGIRFWLKLKDFWRRAPAIWEDLFVKGLQLGLGGSQNNIGNDFKISQNKNPDKEWYLLRLHCQHIPKNGVDIEDTNNVKILAKQAWWAEMFLRLNSARAIDLLKKLITANAEYDFLRSTSQTTILKTQSVIGQRNFNAWLLLTLLQSKSSDLSENKQAENRAKSGESCKPFQTV